MVNYTEESFKTVALTNREITLWVLRRSCWTRCDSTWFSFNWSEESSRQQLRTAVILRRQLTLFWNWRVFQIPGHQNVSLRGEVFQPMSSTAPGDNHSSLIFRTKSVARILVLIQFRYYNDIAQQLRVDPSCAIPSECTFKRRGDSK